ncbi:hypothetical protein EYV94_24365 [Puteibacter caeruleilacunae]|nr:hypothetical protein EYV94_24365 [Puteibacter caeruleilacunae]
MNNKIIIAIFGLLISLYSCSDDDIPFEGTDSYISFFQLEKDGTKYDALITDDKITVEITENVDLINAKADYAIAELSEISPDPKTISDWEDPVEFIVKSYNNEEKKYVFSLIKKEVINNGDVSLLTQADVDAFASKGATRIDGNLIIGDVDNLDILKQITEVSKNIIVKDSCGLAEFDALVNLKKAGNIYFGSADKAFDPAQDMDINFEALVDVGEIYVNTAKVKTVAFPNLKNAYAITVNSNSVDTFKFASLCEVYGNLAFQSETNDYVDGSNEALKKIELTSLRSILGSVTFDQLNKVELIDLSRLTSVGGRFEVNSLTALNSIKLDVLGNVDNAIEFEGFDALLSLHMPKLSRAGSLKISGGWSGALLEELEVPELTTVNNEIELSSLSALLNVQLPKLTQAGSLKIAGSWGVAVLEGIDCPELTSLNNELNVSNVAMEELSFPKLTSCPSINFTGIEKVTSLDLSQIKNLETLELVSGYVLEDLSLPQNINELTLNGGSLATVFPTLHGVETVAEKLTVTNYKLPKITISSVKELKMYSQTSGQNQTELEFVDLEIIGELEISLTELETFEAPKLKKMDKLNLKNPWALKAIEIPLLREITSELIIKGANWAGAASNCLMSDLNAFAAVTKIGSVDIVYCANLNDFSGLKNAIPSLSEENWKVENCQYNPTYQNMVDGDYIGL